MVYFVRLDNPRLRMIDGPDDGSHKSRIDLQGRGVVMGAGASRLVDIQLLAIPVGTARGSHQQHAQFIDAADDFVAHDA